MPYAEDGPITLSYREFGRQHEGIPVLGIMGFALDARFWAAQVPAVTESRRFITYDNRGVGRSGGPPVSAIAEMAGDAVRVLEAAGVDKAIVFGQSMGGAVAQQLALQHPELVEALVLAVTWARPMEFMRRQNDVARFLISRGEPMTLTEATLVRMFTPSFFEVGHDMIDQIVASFTPQGGPELPDREVLLAQLEAIDAHDTLGRLGEISCPTLVLGGRMDMMVPGFASEEIAAAVPGAELVMFETGHACMLEEMDTFNARVSSFLASLPT